MMRTNPYEAAGPEANNLAVSSRQSSGCIRVVLILLLGAGAHVVSMGLASALAVAVTLPRGDASLVVASAYGGLVGAVYGMGELPRVLPAVLVFCLFGRRGTLLDAAIAGLLAGSLSYPLYASGALGDSIEARIVYVAPRCAEPVLASILTVYLLGRSVPEVAEVNSDA